MFSLQNLLKSNVHNVINNRSQISNLDINSEKVSQILGKNLNITYKDPNASENFDHISSLFCNRSPFLSLIYSDIALRSIFLILVFRS